MRFALVRFAPVSDTIFGDLDFSVAQNLESVDHHGPSTIGVDTLIKSRGNIPEVFLRGCGLSDTWITYVRSLTTSPLEFYSCFISYSSKDKSFARRLHDALQGRGIRCWLDEKEVLPGDDIMDGVDRGIRIWDKVLLCCSRASLEGSVWVDREIDKALQKEERLWKSRGQKVLSLIPLNLDNFMFEWEGGKASVLRSRLAPDFTDWERDNAKFEAQFERVVQALRADDGGREPPPEPRL